MTESANQTGGLQQIHTADRLQHECTLHHIVPSPIQQHLQNLIWLQQTLHALTACHWQHVTYSHHLPDQIHVHWYMQTPELHELHTKLLK